MHRGAAGSPEQPARQDECRGVGHEHKPLSQRRYAGWTPGRIARGAAETGPSTSALIDITMREKRHTQQGLHKADETNTVETAGEVASGVTAGASSKQVMPVSVSLLETGREHGETSHHPDGAVTDPTPLIAFARID